MAGRTVTRAEYMASTKELLQYATATGESVAVVDDEGKIRGVLSVPRYEPDEDEVEALAAARAEGFAAGMAAADEGRMVLRGEAAAKFLAQMDAPVDDETAAKRRAFLAECEAVYQKSRPRSADETARRVLLLWGIALDTRQAAADDIRKNGATPDRIRHAQECAQTLRRAFGAVSELAHKLGRNARAADNFDGTDALAESAGAE